MVRTVIETPTFIRAAQRAGMNEAEVLAVVDLIAGNPASGDEIRGSGGCRKVRVTGHGKRKSGGYRVITFYSGSLIPAFLLTVYSKSDEANLSQGEINDLRVLTKALVAAYGTRARAGKRKAR